MEHHVAIEARSTRPSFSHRRVHHRGTRRENTTVATDEDVEPRPGQGFDLLDQSALLLTRWRKKRSLEEERVMLPLRRTSQQRRHEVMKRAGGVQVRCNGTITVILSSTSNPTPLSPTPLCRQGTDLAPCCNPSLLILGCRARRPSGEARPPLLKLVVQP